MTEKNKTRYQRTWDRYVKEMFPKIKEKGSYNKQDLLDWQVLNTEGEPFIWPGDEWGSIASAEGILKSTLYDYLPESKAEIICEIGSGAGRYTTLMLGKYPKADIFTFDVSGEFEAALKERCHKEVDEGRLKTCLLDSDYTRLEKFVESNGVAGQVDAIVSYDAMVHVELHTLVVYWISAARILREGGILAMSVSDCLSEKGFLKLLHDAPGAFSSGGQPGYIFQWISPEIVRFLLDRLGFSFELFDCNGRDLFFSAKLIDRDRHQNWINKANSKL